MTSALDPPPVASGQQYTVTEVDGRHPQSLADFIGDIHLLMSRNDQVFQLRGAGAPAPSGSVRFYQKDLAQHDRDIRVWTINESDDTTFLAEPFAAF